MGTYIEEGRVKVIIDTHHENQLFQDEDTVFDIDDEDGYTNLELETFEYLGDDKFLCSFSVINKIYYVDSDGEGGAWWYFDSYNSSEIRDFFNDVFKECGYPFTVYKVLDKRMHESFEDDDD